MFTFVPPDGQTLVICEPLITAINSYLMTTITHTAVLSAKFGLPFFYVATVVAVYIRLGLIASEPSAQRIVEFFQFLIVFTVVGAAAEGTSLYMDLFVGPLFNLGAVATSFIANNGVSAGTDPNKIFDILLTKILLTGQTYYNDAPMGWSCLLWYLYGTVVILFGVPFLAITAASIESLTIVCALLLSLGPWFLQCAPFKPVQKVFASWLSYLMGFNLEYVLQLLGVVFLLHFCDGQIDALRKSGTTGGVVGIISFLFVWLVVFMISVRVGSIATGLMHVSPITANTLAARINDSLGTGQFANRTMSAGARKVVSSPVKVTAAAARTVARPIRAAYHERAQRNNRDYGFGGAKQGFYPKDGKFKPRRR